MQQPPNNISINSNQQTRRNDQRLKQLKSQVLLTDKDLESLMSKPSKFASKVIELNHFALQNLHADRPDEALMYLVEAQKILEKAGEMELDVEKKLVILTLHNLACAYQRNWELEVCSNYLEALIYNLNLILKSVESAPSTILSSLSTAKQHQSPVTCKYLSSKAIELMLGIEIKQRLGRYYLQFCAVNSQIRNHSGALISARKSIQTMKKMFQQMSRFLRHYNTQKQGREEFEQKLRLIEQVSRLNDNINVSQYEMILETTKFYLRRWEKSEEKEMVMSEISTEIEAKFRNFSIGSIAQMEPVEYDELFMATEGKKSELLKTEQIIQKVLVLIIGYFTISTELRLLAQCKHPISQLSQPNISLLAQDHPQTREAQIFHLFSIMLASLFIPFEILYMKHILLSYKNHYAVDLADSLIHLTQNNKVYDEFLFTISDIRKGDMLGADGEDSDIRKGGMLGADGEESVKHSEILQGEEAKTLAAIEKSPFHKFSHIISSIQQKPTNSNSKPKPKRKTKSKFKSKSLTKKSTLKTISALSAHSKNKEKLEPNHSKSPQIHTQPSLSKTKHKKSSLKLPLKITSLQHMTEENQRKKQKSKDIAKKKHEYAGIKTADVKKKKNVNAIEQTNAYFLKKASNSNVKLQSKSKSKDSKIKKEVLKGLMPNNPTQLYFHKVEKWDKPSKSKSKQKSLKKPPVIFKPSSPLIYTKKSLYTHYM